MKKYARIFRFTATLAAALCASAGVFAQDGERILSFHADIEVHRDASISVAETITVRARGKEIKRGIYRDVPMRGFEPDQVLLDGAPSDYHTSPSGDGTPGSTRRAHHSDSPSSN